MASPDPRKRYEFRCPVHGFIELNHWERSIVDTPEFQRLRRIRQLAWTEYTYPGATHTRFEHTLGVMHVASRIYEAVVRRSRRLLEETQAYDDAGISRDHQLVRLAALLHDVGHSPFSHAGEDLFPIDAKRNRRSKHEHYSAAVVRLLLKDAIETHPFNQSFHFTADEIASFLDGTLTTRSVIWREIVSSQMDADRMDYLLRDSLHAGVQYGRYDLDRVISTMQVVQLPGDDGEPLAPRIGISEGGWHAAEALVLARYFMFTQVYFHKTRIAYDIHVREALKDLLQPSGEFPGLSSADSLREYLAWDDWKVLGLIAAGGGGPHGERLRKRNHYREVFRTVEVPNLDELTELEELKAALGDLVVATYSANSSWYKTGTTDIVVASESVAGDVHQLSHYSRALRNLLPNQQVLLFVDRENVPKALKIKADFFTKRTK
jgi:uncharacterized protein